MLGRVLKILSWILIAGRVVGLMGFVSGEANKVLCNRIEVILSDTVLNRFVTRTDIRTMLEETGMQLQGYPMAEINIRSLERTIEEDPYIKNAEVSKDITGRLEVRVVQRVPLIRIMPEGLKGYYLDKEGTTLPLSDQFTPLILLATGFIQPPGPDGKLSDQLKEIHQFSSYLTDHPLWNGQIVQIYVNRRGEYELIPRVGAHHILIGSIDQWEKKMENLELLYRQGLSRYGWNTYGTINLKYTNQVICTKR